MSKIFNISQNVMIVMMAIFIASRALLVLNLGGHDDHDGHVGHGGHDSHEVMGLRNEPAQRASFLVCHI